jgi:D-cysteine desulfhydrase family pyridoxal phosphate-dependent enzyme
VTVVPGINDLPRVSIAALPTPLYELERLRRALGGGPRLYVKRDDNTGLALGGNKARKLEFLMAEVMAAGADTVITVGGPQSNHCRMTAAICARLGLSCILVLTGERPPILNGNLLLDAIAGAELVFAPGGEGLPDGDTIMAHVADRARARGAKPHIIPLGGSTPTGALGYAAAMFEVAGQAAPLGLAFDHIVLASGSGGTQAGIEAALRILRYPARAHGISVSRAAAALQQRVAEIGVGCARLLDLDVEIAPSEVIVHDGYVGEGYGKVTDGCLEAVRLTARHEGVFLDTVYTGKAMAGLIDLVRRGVFGDGEKVLFIHTGGAPALFVYERYFQETVGGADGVDGADRGGQAGQGRNGQS